MAGYRATFDEKIANLIGTSIAELDKAVAEGGEELLVKTVLEARKNSGLVDADGYYDLLNKLNVSWGFSALAPTGVPLRATMSCPCHTAAL